MYLMNLMYIIINIYIDTHTYRLKIWKCILKQLKVYIPASVFRRLMFAQIDLSSRERSLYDLAHDWNN